jgi:hypothetical protein
VPRGCSTKKLDMFGLHRSDWKISVVYASIAALLWITLYRLNAWIFSSFQVNEYVCWIFLPAAVRLITVLLMGMPASVGLFIGTYVTCNPVTGVNVIDSIEVAILSAASPFLAVLACTKILKLANDLHGLNVKHLAVFSLVSGVFNVALHDVFLFESNKISDLYESSISMLAGDVTGTWVVLVVAAQFLRVISPPRKID